MALTAVSPALLVPLFLVSLAVTLAAARLFARRLDRLATSRGIPEALVGVLTAVAADSPEISAALVALVTGAPSVSVGVVVGSNLFNLAAMIGVSALVAGRVVLRREALVLEGAVGLVALAAGAAVLVGVVPVAAFVVVMAVLVPYVLVLVLGPQVLTRTRLHARMIEGLRRALAEREPAARRPPAIPPPMWPEALLFGADVALIALGSIGMVQAALALGDRWGVRAEVIGVLVLAPLTSLPNAATAVRLGVGGRGSALVSETFNSNTINLVAGLAIPALFVGTPGLSRTGRLDLIWLGAMTVFCLALLWRPPGMRRGGAAAVVALYLGFVATQAMLR